MEIIIGLVLTIIVILSALYQSSNEKERLKNHIDAMKAVNELESAIRDQVLSTESIEELSSLQIKYLDLAESKMKEQGREIGSFESLDDRERIRYSYALMLLNGSFPTTSY